MLSAPDVAIAWVSRSKARDLLGRIGRDERPVTHEVLDELPPGKVLAHLRSVLVATGTLPPRDERLVALEKWITETVQARSDLAERRILHGYAVWHHMRRLRRRLGEDHTTRLQDLKRCHVTARRQLPHLAHRRRAHTGDLHPAGPGTLDVRPPGQLPR